MSKHTIKVISTLVILLAVVISSSLYVNSKLYASAKTLESHIDSLESSIRSNDWAKANSSLTFIKNDWERISKSWAMLLDHIEIDNIDITLSRMTEYIGMQESPSALAETATFRKYINHIPEKESFNLENFF